MSGIAVDQLALAEQVYDLVGPPRQRYCPIELTAKQEVFALVQAREALFGGAAGCGKSVTLLMTALMYADVPGYAALLLRPSVSEFTLPGGLLELAADWLTHQGDLGRRPEDVALARPGTNWRRRRHPHLRIPRRP